LGFLGQINYCQKEVGPHCLFGLLIVASSIACSLVFSFLPLRPSFASSARRNIIILPTCAVAAATAAKEILMCIGGG
jgi:hypothetical protein